MKPTLKMGSFSIRGEIRRVDAPSAEKGELCAICLTEFESQNEEAGKYNDQNGTFHGNFWVKVEREIHFPGKVFCWFPIILILHP